MNRVSARPLIALFVVSTAGLGLCAPGVAAAATLTAASTKATCSQLSKAEIQPLLVNPITKVTVKPETSIQFNGKRTHIGQQCVFAAGPGDSEALTVTVVGGPFAAKAYATDFQSLGPRPTRVQGVGSKAIRAPVDSKGAAGTPMLSSIKGSTYCEVVPQSDDIPGVGELEEAAGATADIGNTAYGEIAAAIGTICNRVYGSGNTTPDLSGLTASAASAATPTSTNGTLPTDPTLPTDGGG
jgi:hypothetical protein